MYDNVKNHGISEAPDGTASDNSNIEDNLPHGERKRQNHIPEFRKDPSFYTVPKRDGSVWPEDICPAYTEREGAIPSLRGCWYCKYADFHLKDETVLEVGICRWPKKVME